MDSQIDLGLALLGRARNPEAIGSAAGMFGDSVDPRINRAIGVKYAWLNAEPRRRDSGCFQRSALVRALRGRASGEDVPLLEQALWTVEILNRWDSANELRAAALVTLNEVDGRLASFQATRLLTDAHEMSSEPALTAARLLAQCQELLPLYALVLGDGPPEVIAECLRGLSTLPESLLRRLLERYRQEKDDVVIVGVFDLLMAHDCRPALVDVVAGFLDGSQSLDLYRFFVNAIVASRDPVLVGLLRRSDSPASDSPKGKLLAEALALIPG